MTTARIAEGKKWTVLTGDVREVCKTLEADSFHAFLCDPPYGLKPGKTCTWDDIEEGRATSKGGFMGRAWDRAVPGPSTWREVLRVLLPGAPGVAFFGSRTYHRGACAIEDAGFDACDMFSWLHGQGWPKGLDMAKAFDKRRHDRAQVLVVTKWLAEQRDRAGVTNGDIDRAFGLTGMAGHWTSQASQPLVPTLEQIPKLFEVLKVEEIPDEIRELIIELNGRKGEHGEAWKSAEIADRVVGTDRVAARPVAKAAQGIVGPHPRKAYAIKVPNTELAKEWDGYNTQLKPACEPAAVVRKPFPGTFCRNAEEHGCGPYNVDGCRIGSDGGTRGTNYAKPGLFGIGGKATIEKLEGVGRYPTNVILGHLPECRHVGTRPDPERVPITESTGQVVSENRAATGPNYGRRRVDEVGRPDLAVWECAPECAVARLDAQTGDRPAAMTGRAPADAKLDVSDMTSAAPKEGAVMGRAGGTGPIYADDGGASRYYFQSAWMPGELEEVAAAFERFYYAAKASDGERGTSNDHPTVKPMALMKYLATLLRPPRPGARLLVPFCGSGSEMLGAMLAGWDEVVGIELDPKMADVARWRIENAVIRSTVRAVR